MINKSNLKKNQIKLILFIPNNINVTLGDVKKPSNKINYVYVYSSNNYILLFFKTKGFSFDIVCNLITIYFYNNNRYFIKELNNKITNLVKALCHYFIKKIKFAGKSYKIEKVDSFTKNNLQQNIKSSVFNFKFSYSKFKKILVLVFNAKIYHIKKTKIYLYSANKVFLNTDVRTIIKLREWNKYTQRGLRKNRQIIYRGEGKKSTY